MRVLLVDHDSEGLETIARAIRGVLELDCVTSKGDALLLLRQNTYDVLIACERAVDGSGLDLLGRTTRTAVPLKRIFAAAPERLQLLGPRLAPFKVQRTINYPIDLEELWLAIAQVTGGPNDETDGTIERVVLDERGIPSAGTTARAPIPARPPAPLGGMRASPPPPSVPAPAVSAPIAASASGARTAAARVAQPVPEPPLRAPPPPRAPPPAVRPPAAPQMRAPAPPMRPIPPMPMPPAAAMPAPREPLQDWTPEVTPTEDDFAQVAEQARMGVQRKVVDEASRRKRQQLLTACGIAVAVAGVLVFLFEKFYDPDARAREKAIAQEVSRMAEQQKVTDNLTLIEIDIENAIMNNELEVARTELARLIEKSPSHPRREFLQDSYERALELQKLGASGQPPAPAQVLNAPAAAERRAPARAVAKEPPAERTAPARNTARPNDRTVAQRSSRETPPPSTPVSQSRTYGAPISEPLQARTIQLDSPINSPPTATPITRADTFSGRTVEASDSAVGRTAVVPAPGSSAAAGTADVAMPPAAAPVDVVPAKIVKRVTPVVSADVPRKAKGFVVVKFEIGENGRVSNVAVVESTPPGVFDDSATTAVRKWIYEPRKENGVPVSSQSKARLVFDAAD